MTTSTLDFEARNVQWLEFELSNQCHYAKAHDWCPRYHLGNSPKIELPTYAIEKAVEFFKAYDFSGTVYFSIYNEPLLDSRIYDLIRYVKREMPKCMVQMFTNCVLLNDQTAELLASAGVNVLWLSIYNEQMDTNFESIMAKLRGLGVITSPVERSACFLYSGGYGHDERVGIYGRKLGDRTPCYMPIQYFLINCKGEVMLCWDDWKSTVTFGNINTDSVADVLMRPERLAWIERLKRGKRDGVCAGCARPTELCISEYRGRLKL